MEFLSLFLILLGVIGLGYLTYLAVDYLSRNVDIVSSQPTMTPEDKPARPEVQTVERWWEDPQGRDKWLVSLALYCNLDPWDRRKMDRLESWVETVVKLAASEFGGGLSAKLYLYPYFQTEADEYRDIPYNWRSLHFFERLGRELRADGLADLPSRRNGVVLNGVGYERFEAE